MYMKFCNDRFNIINITTTTKARTTRQTTRQTTQQSVILQYQLQSPQETRLQMRLVKLLLVPELTVWIVDFIPYVNKCCVLHLLGLCLKFGSPMIITLSVHLSVCHYTPHERSSGGIQESRCLSVRLSFCLSVCADSCPTNNFFFGLTLAYHIWHMGVSP